VNLVGQNIRERMRSEAGIRLISLQASLQDGAR